MSVPQTRQLQDLLQRGFQALSAGQIAEALNQFEQAMDLVKDHEPSSLALTRSVTRCAVANSKLFQFERALAVWDTLEYLEVPHEVISVFLHVVLDELNRGDVDVNRADGLIAIEERNPRSPLRGRLAMDPGQTALGATYCRQTADEPDMTSDPEASRMGQSVTVQHQSIRLFF